LIASFRWSATQFELQIAAEHFLGVLADHQLVQVLQVGQAVEHQDAFDQLVGMLHFLDRLFVLMLAQRLEPPMTIHARVQKILVDGGQLVLELAIQQLDYLLVGFHDSILAIGNVDFHGNPRYRKIKRGRLSGRSAHFWHDYETDIDSDLRQ
jgi:hypothetical protein